MKVIKEKEDQNALQRKIVTQWKEFSGTEAYKDMMEYANSQREMLINYAEERAIPHPNGHGKLSIDTETANSLLQNARGVNILRTYIGLRSK